MILNIFKTNKSRSVVLTSRVTTSQRIDIEKYVQFAFGSNYEQMALNNSLDSFLNEHEDYYIAALNSLQNIKNKQGDFFNEDDKMYFYSSLAMAEVYEKICISLKN